MMMLLIGDDRRLLEQYRQVLEDRGISATVEVGRSWSRYEAVAHLSPMRAEELCARMDIATRPRARALPREQ